MNTILKFDFLKTALLFLTIHVTNVAQRKVSCRYKPSDVLYCAQKYNIFKIPKETAGYGFGFGSVLDAENMCKSLWHVHVQACVGKRVLERCKIMGASEFQLSMWRFIFDPRPYERAAIYLCHSHNMRIFRAHLDNCLIPFEPHAQNCSERQSEEIAKATAQLAAHSEDVWHGSSDEYVAYIQRELSATFCEATVNKINCITTLLERNCSTDVVRLIQNYFRELLPKGCIFSEETANASHRKRSQWPDYVASQPAPRSNKKIFLDSLALNDARYVNDAHGQVKTSNAQPMTPHHCIFMNFIFFVFHYI